LPRETKDLDVEKAILIIISLNSALCDAGRVLDSVFTAENPRLFVLENMALIDDTLEIISEALRSTPYDIRLINTWAYDRGGEPYYKQKEYSKFEGSK
jgi:hypothetical protein